MEKKKKILFVDDEKDFLKLVKLNLEQTGKFEVFTLSSAEDIISQVRSLKPDLIILDLLMPGIGGIEACDMLNKEPQCKGVPVIFFSALDRTIDKERGYKAGAVEYLTKPMSADELISKIEKIFMSKSK